MYLVCVVLKLLNMKVFRVGCWWFSSSNGMGRWIRIYGSRFVIVVGFYFLGLCIDEISFFVIIYYAVLMVLSR